MSTQVNLLPGAYIRGRRHHRRFRVAVFIGCLLLGAELIAGIVVHGRAERTRELYAAADLARQNSASTRRDLEDPRREADRLGLEVRLAERLRTKHRWSRLLGTLAHITPNRVMLTSISTDPPRWAPNILGTIATGAVEVSGPGRPARALLRGVTLIGQAVDHQDLATFMAAIHGTNIFASMDLRQARREKIGEQESIMFELECHW
jgi:Tfp pilus assembly protein PilN